MWCRTPSEISGTMYANVVDVVLYLVEQVVETKPVFIVVVFVPGTEFADIVCSGLNNMRCPYAAQGIIFTAVPH